jgi:outer membrane receptor protein involved in Fe transport
MGQNPCSWAAGAPAGGTDPFQFFEEESKVVTASKKEEKLQDTPGVVAVITAEDIRRFGARNLRDVLDRAPSLYTLNGTLYPSNVVSIRGDTQTQADSHVLWLVDGRPMREVAFGGVNFPLLTSYPVDLVDHLEIVRGPGSVLYGSNAYTGIINIITKKVPEREATVRGGGGSYNTTYGAFSGGVPLNDQGSVTGAGRYFRSAGWRYSATDEGRINSSMRVKEEDTSFALASRYRDWTLTGFYAEAHHLDLGTLPRWPDDPTNTLKGMFDVGYKHALAENWNTAVNTTYNFSRLGVTDPGEIDTNRDGTSFLTEATIQGTPLRDLNITLGGTGDYHEIVFDPEGLHPHETWWSFYSQADYRLIPSVKLLGGAQYNKPEGVSANISPRGGAIVTFDPNWGAKLLYGEAFRAPYPAETQMRSTALYGNPDLKPETIQTYDAQVFYQSKPVRGSLTFFHSRQRDRIIRVVVGGVPTFANVDNLTSDGIELEGVVNATSRLFFTGSYLYQINKNQNAVHDATFMPTHMLKTGVSYAGDSGVTMGLFNTYIGERGDVNAVNSTAREVNPPAQAYHWLTLHAIFDLQKFLKQSLFSGMEFRVYAINLLNEQVYDPEFNRRQINTVPAREGRSAYGEISVKFGGRNF